MRIVIFGFSWIWRLFGNVGVVFDKFDVADYESAIISQFQPLLDEDMIRYNTAFVQKIVLPSVLEICL